MKTYNWVTLGCGVIAHQLADAMQQEGRTLYGVANRTYSKAKDFAEKHHIPKVYENIQDIFTDENVDIIYISTPHNTHIQYLKEALRHGKHILCEKSITLNSRELEEAKQLAEENQLILAEAMTIYHMPLYKELKKKIKDEIYKSNKTDYIWNHMIEKSTFKEIPDQLINDRIDVLVDGLKAELKSSNYSLKDNLSAYGIQDEDALREQYKSSCESTVKVFLVADAIAAEKKIAVTDDDIKEYFNGEDTAQYEKLYSKPYLNRVVLNDLVLKEIEKTTTVK